MDINNETIERIERKIWHLMLLAIVVILYLTLSLLGLQFLNFMGETDFVLFSKNAYKWSFFLTVLVLLFCAYMILNQRRLLHLSKSLFKEKESSENLSEDVTTLAALFDVSSRINSQQKLMDVLDTISKEMLRCFRADRSSIMLYDRKSKKLKTMVSHGKNSALARDAIVPIGGSVGGWVLKTGQPLLLNGEINPSDFPGIDVKGRKISSSICVPLKVTNRPIGVLTLNLVDTDRIFSNSDLKLIGIFANNAAIAINNATLSREKEHRISLQTMLEQFHSPQVVRELVRKIEDRDRNCKIRQKLEMTVLFADIRGFSEMTSHVEPEQLMDFLDEFYDAMTEIVFKNGGSIDKFIGDEVMAFFGAPLQLENSSENAARAALEMVASFEDLIRKFSGVSPHFRDLGIGIGVNTGVVFVGNVGSRKRYDYTVIGNAVNLARRLCSRAESNEILAAAKTAMRLNGSISTQFIDKARFKGNPALIDVYGIVPQTVDGDSVRKCA